MSKSKQTTKNRAGTGGSRKHIPLLLGGVGAAAVLAVVLRKRGAPATA